MDRSDDNIVPVGGYGLNDAPAEVPVSARAESRGLLLFAGLFLLYAATAAGRLQNLDAECRYDAAMSVIRHGDIDVDTHHSRARYYAVSGLADNGRRYQVYSPGQTVLMVPFYAAGRGAAVLLGREEPFAADAGAVLVVMVMHPLVSAGVCLVMFLILVEAGVSRRGALLTAAVAGLATMGWQYSKFPAEESQVALLLLVGLRHGLLYGRGSGRGRDLLFMAAALGGAHVFKVSAAPAALAIALGIVFEIAMAKGPEWRTRAAEVIAAGAAGAVMAAAVTLLHNWWRFGGALDMGYARSGLWQLRGASSFDVPFAQGFFGLLLSPGKGVFLYNPVLLLAVVAAPRLAKRMRFAAVAAPGALLGTVLFYSKYHFWPGDWAWGPRFLVSVLPIALLPAGLVIDRVLDRRRGLGWVLALIGLGVALQLSSLVYRYDVEIRQRKEARIEGYWDVRTSVIPLRFENMGARVIGRKSHRGQQLDPDLWPALLGDHLGKKSVPVVWVLWIGCVAAALWVLGRLARGGAWGPEAEGRLPDGPPAPLC